MLLNEDPRSVEVYARGGSVYCRRLGSLERITPWGPEAGAWRKAGRDPWISFDPEVDLELLESLAAEAGRQKRLWPGRKRQIDAARLLVDAWPEDVRGVVRKFRAGQWRLLLFVNAGGAPAMELLRSNAALGYLAATRGGDAGPREWLGLRQREIAGLAGFPATGRAARTLRKAPARWISDELLEEVRKALGDEEAGTFLSYVRRINPMVVAVARDPALRNRVSPECVARLGRAAASVPHCDLTERIRALAERARRENVLAPAIRELGDIDRAFRPAPPAGGATAPAHAPRTNGAFPPPPLPDTGEIRAIRERGELRAEGTAMGHCVGGAGYARRVARGELYVYRVLAPERLTVAIGRGRHGWEVSEARGRFNRQARPESMRTIRMWLRGQQVPAPAVPPALAPLPPPAHRRPGAAAAQLSFEW